MSILEEELYRRHGVVVTPKEVRTSRGTYPISSILKCTTRAYKYPAIILAFAVPIALGIWLIHGFLPALVTYLVALGHYSMFKAATLKVELSDGSSASLQTRFGEQPTKLFEELLETIETARRIEKFRRMIIELKADAFKPFGARARRATSAMIQKLQQGVQDEASGAEWDFWEAVDARYVGETLQDFNIRRDAVEMMSIAKALAGRREI